MKKGVIIGIAVIILIVSSIWVLQQPAKPSTFEIVFETVQQSCEEESAGIAQMLKALTENNPNICPDDPILDSYCQAAFGKDVCENPAINYTFHHDLNQTCLAILTKDISACGDDTFCVGLVGDAEACSRLKDEVNQADCLAIVQRDIEYFKDTSACLELVREEMERTKCLEQATSQESVDKCLQP